MVYTTYIPAVSETYLLCTFKLLSCATMLCQCACISHSSNFHSVPLSVPKLKITQNGICLANTRYIKRICQAYTVKSRCITLTEMYALLISSPSQAVFYIQLPSTMAWVYYIETPSNT